MIFYPCTVLHDGAPVGCAEIGGALHPLVHPRRARAGDRPVRRMGALVRASRRRPSERRRRCRRTRTRLAPLLYPGKILCAGANYYDHIAEMGVPDTRKEAQRLFFFFKPPRNAVVGPGATVQQADRHARRSTGRSSSPP